MKKVSLIIPVYNVAYYIRDSLYSALDQTYDNIEYIIVDDCGQDESMKIVNEIIKEHIRGKYITILSHEKNKGVGESRNSGINFATGEYIYFMDSDDLIMPDCVECLVNLIEEKNVDAVVGSYEVHENRIINSRIYCGEYYGEDVILNYFSEKKWDCLCWNLLLKRDVLNRKNIYFPQLSYSEDVCFLFNLYINIESIALTSHITYKYLRRTDSITSGKINFFKMSDAFEAYKIMYSYLQSFKQHNLYNVLANYLNNNRLYVLRYLVAASSCQIEDFEIALVPFLNLKSICFADFSIKDKCKHFVFLLPHCIKLSVLSFLLRSSSNV